MSGLGRLCEFAGSPSCRSTCAPSERQVTGALPPDNADQANGVIGRGAGIDLPAGIKVKKSFMSPVGVRMTDRWPNFA